MLQKTSFVHQLINRMFKHSGNDTKLNNGASNFYHRNTSNNRNFKCNQRKERALTRYRKRKR